MSDFRDLFLGITGGLFFISVVVLLLIFGPLLTIWSLNTLFPILAIPYTLKTWFAIIIFSGLFRSTMARSKDKDK